MIEIEKLVKQLRHCAGYAAYYDGDYNGIYNQAADALEKLQAELEQVKAERDAAVDGLRVCSIENNTECQYCLYRTARSFCWNCTDGSNWKFRGQKED